MTTPPHTTPEDERGTFLPRLAVRRPVTVMMGVLALIVLGVIAYLQIPLQLLPSGYTPPFLYVQVRTRPSPPTDVEENIAIPIEEIFGTVRNLHRQRSWVRSESVGFLLEFKEGTDMDTAYNQVRDRLERKTPDLPPETSNYFIWKYNPNNDPVYWMGASLPENVPKNDARYMLETNLVRKLERLPGVSRVELEGAPNKEVHIEVDDNRANAAGIGVYALVQALQRDNFTLSAGVVEDGAQRTPIRAIARYTDLETVRDIPVGPSGLRLRDVATVQYITTGEDSIYRINSKPGVIVKVYKESEANTVAVCEAIRSTVANPGPELQGFSFLGFFDQGFYIQESIDNLQETALWGALFAVLILLFFLRNGRITLVITLAIPASLLVTLVVMYFTGSTLNVLSLMGLMLSVGMVVDNSIVVVENIQRLSAPDRSRMQAAILGTGEVALAIIVATSTTIVVFLPLILMSGSQTLSFYLGKIGYPVCISLVASLFVSLIVIPLASSYMSNKDLQTKPEDQKNITNAVVHRLESGYRSILGWCMRRRTDAALIALALFLSVFFPMQHVKQSDVQTGNPNDFRLFINFDPTMSFEEKDAYLQKAEAILETKRDSLGIDNVLARLGGTWGRARLRVFLKPLDQRPTEDKNELIKMTREVLPPAPGVSFATSWGDRSGSDTITVDIQGPDSARLAVIARDISWRLRNIPGIISAEPETDDESTQELQLSVQRELARQRGLSPLLIGGTIDYALRGRRLNDFQADDRPVPMLILSPKEDRTTLSDIQRMEVRDPLSGGGIPIGSLTTNRVAPSYSRINRSDRRTILTINITAKTDDLSALSEQIDQATASYPFPRGYSLGKGQRFQRLQDNSSERTFALSLAILFVFLLMGVLFESFVLPFSIVVSIPFAFVGVYWLLYITDTTFDVMAGVGLVILIGVVVNNAVVLIDLVQLLRSQGYTRTDAILEAGQKRLRPILMTALTTIFGLLPMAAGDASLVGIPYAPLGRALIGGLIASTVLTLFVVPLCYSFFDDLSTASRDLALSAARAKLPNLRRSKTKPLDASSKQSQRH